MKEKGKFIVIEGPDGVGKTTIINNLKKEYPSAIFTREPGGTKIGNDIRKILLYSKESIEKNSEINLFMISLQETTKKIIEPALKTGKIVISDRWYYSTQCYQFYTEIKHTKTPIIKHSISNNLMRKYLKNYNIIKPDLTIVLQASWKTIMERINKRSKENNIDNFEIKDINFKKKVYEYYKYLSEFPNYDNIININTEKSIDLIIKNIKKLFIN